MRFRPSVATHFTEELVRVNEDVDVQNGMAPDWSQHGCSDGRWSRRWRPHRHVHRQKQIQTFATQMCLPNICLWKFCYLRREEEPRGAEQNVRTFRTRVKTVTLLRFYTHKLKIKDLGNLFGTFCRAPREIYDTRFCSSMRDIRRRRPS